MSKPKSIFAVLIDGGDVQIDRLDPGKRGYVQAGKAVILRERDAIELFQQLKASGDGFDGRYYFQYLETAKTFAMLRLKAAEQAVENNLDQIQVYQGKGSSRAS